MGWAALIPLAISAISAGVGAINKGKAERERRALANARPELGNSPYLDETNNLLSAELAAGNNTPAMQAMRQANDANFSSSLNAILQGGGSANNVADLFGQQQSGAMRMAMYGDDLRRQNIQNLIAANQGSEGFRQQQFQYNQYAPWADRSQATAAALQAANNQMWSGISSAGSSLTNWAGSQQYANNYNKALKKPTATTPTVEWSNGIKNPYQ